MFTIKKNTGYILYGWPVNEAFLGTTKYYNIFPINGQLSMIPNDKLQSLFAAALKVVHMSKT